MELTKIFNNMPNLHKLKKLGKKLQNFLILKLKTLYADGLNQELNDIYPKWI